VTATSARHVRVLAACALLAAGLAPSLPIARAVEARVRGWAITRTGTAPRAIDGQFTASGVSEESTVVMFALTGRSAARRVDFRFVTTTAEWGVDGWAQIRAPGVPAPACPAACASPVGVPESLYVTSNDRALSSTVYVAAYDVTDPVLRIDSPGWVVRPWQPALRMLTTATANGDGLSAAHESVGTFRGGTVGGGQYGSIAAAALPCDNWGRGAGALAGAGRTSSMGCGLAMHAIDGAPGKVRWTLDADVTGSGSVTGVLVVVDYPRG
jgi:hypothetical protein